MMVPDFAFGIIGDTQYCNEADGQQWGDAQRVRRYTMSLPKFGDAVKHFREWYDTGPCPIPVCVLLGDVLDGQCKRSGTTVDAMKAIVNQIIDNNSGSKDTDADSNSTGPQWHFLVGNHDLYNYSREELYASDYFVPSLVKSDCSPTKLYYSIVPHQGYRFLYLDPFEISTCGAINTAAEEEAKRIIAIKNPNVAANGDWLAGLSDEDKRYVPYNGAISQTQIEWLINELSISRKNNEKVIVFSHCPIYSDCCRVSGMTWNSETILTLLQQSDNVIAVINGHDHQGGYALDKAGIHHIIPPAVLEADVEVKARGIITVHTEAGYMEMLWDGPPPPDSDWPTKMIFDKSITQNNDKMGLE